MEFVGESLVSVVCEMNEAVSPQKGEGEGARPQAMHEAPATLPSRWWKGSSGLRARTRQTLREPCVISHPKGPAPATITLKQILQSCDLVFGFLNHLQETEQTQMAPF